MLPNDSGTSSEPDHYGNTSKNSSDEDRSNTGGDESEDLTYLVVWGQLTTTDNLNVDFYTVIKPDERIYPLWELGIDQENTRVRRADELKHREFLQNIHLHYPSDQRYAFGDQFREVRTTLIGALASPAQLENLLEEASSTGSLSVENDFSVFFENGMFELAEDDWIKIQLASKGDFLENDGELPDQWDESELQDLDVIEVDDEIYDINLLARISILTSVISGLPAGDLSPGHKIRARLTGGEVSNLPEKLQDPRREGLSVPMEAEVVHTDNDPTLPERIDDDASNYRGIAVQFFEDTLGYGFIHLDERVQFKDSAPIGSENQKSIPSRPMIIFLLITILLLLALVILLYQPILF